MTKLYTFQEEDVVSISEFNGLCLVANEMGTGKTITVLKFLKRYERTMPALVVCPASLKWHWEGEAKKHANIKCEILEGRKAPRIAPARSSCLWIINYDILHDWIPFIKDLNLRTIVFDECHYLASRGTKRTKASVELAQDIPHRIGISGTPITNRPADLFPILHIIRPDLFPSFYSYAKKHCKPRRTPWGWVYDGATRLKSLHKKLTENLMIRRRVVDVLKDLPAHSRHVVNARLTTQGRKEYDYAVNDFIKWLRENFGHGKVSSALKAQQLVKFNYLRTLIGKLKLPFVYNWIEDFLAESDDKLIVFAVNRKVIHRICRRFPDLSVSVTGAVTGRNRQITFDQFNDDKKVRLFVGNIDAAGTGWSCKVSSTVAFAQMAWTPGKHDQCEKRVRGIGRGVKGMPTKAYWLITPNTIEERLCEINQQKSKNIDSAIDGKVSKETLNVFDLLTSDLLERK